MNVERKAHDVTCVICGRRFRSLGIGAMYCSEKCKREGQRRREKSGARRHVARVDSYLAGTGAAHDEIMAARAELAAAKR